MDNPACEQPLIEVLSGRAPPRPPVWLMRQAGRYLPEYRALREKAGSFLDLCFTPELAAEATLQPIRRFRFDAAIIFSDILVIPHALGRRVSFEAGEGPRLDPLASAAEIAALPTAMDEEALTPVYAALRQVKAELPSDIALIGFCGAPWTIATYMVAGQGTADQAPARLLAYSAPEAFKPLIDILADAAARHLVLQLEAGADAVQIFDTWAGVLSPEAFARWCIAPVRRIVEQVRQAVPDAKIIGFPRGANASLAAFAQRTGVDAVSVDWTVAPSFARAAVGERMAVQGNLDPLALVAGGEALDTSVDHVLEGFAGSPHIFNLGHGILPHTPIAHVEQMLARVRRF